MKRRIVDEIVVGVKQQDSSVGGPATTPSLAGGVFASGTRGPAAASAAGPGVLGGRQAHSPAPQLLHQGPSNPCMLTTGPTVVQNVRANSPAVKSDLGGPTMPGSLTYPVQGYQSSSMSASNPNPTLKVHQGGNSVPLTPAQQSQQQQQQFQRLKVEDALSYLDQVKEKFGNQPQVYNNFLDIMKEFKSQSIDTPGVIARVSNLFKGHPELIVGFNTFLPPGYKIEVQSNDQGFAFQVSVSMPSPTNTTSVGSITHHHTLPISSGPSTPVAATPTPTISIPVAAPAVNTPSVVSGGPIAALSQTLPPPSAAASVPPIPIKPVTLPSGPIGLAAVHHAATSLHGYSSSVPASSSPHHPPSGAQPPSMPVPSAPSSGSSGGGGPSSLLAAQSGHAGAQMLAESMQPTPQSQPVDFTHAINYVNKIKNRFQGQPDKYKSFLDILHAYQKEQRSLKEGLATPGKHLTEAEVYSQVAKLFENQEDLVQEFGQFLPDATSHQAALMGAVLQGNKGLANDHTSAKKPLSLKPSFNNASAGLAALSMGVGAISANSKFGQQVKRSPSFSTSSQPPAKKPKMVSLRDVSLADAGKYGSLNDYAYFDKVRKALKSQEVYENFLRCLVLFNQEVVSSSELVQLVTPFLGRFPELLRWIKEFLGHVESSSSTAAGGTSTYQSLHSSALNDVGSNNVGRQDRTAGDHAMEIDYSTCKRLGASYCALPKSYILPKCSGRSQLCKEVLNDTWVSFPTWSEDSTFVTSRKTQYEEYIYRCEDERFELDVVLETNAATIRVLEGVNKKMQRMQPEEMAKFHLDEHLGGTSTTIHQRALRRIYGDKAPDIIMGLKKNPSAAVPVVLRRLKAKEEEWREAQKGFNKIWREQNEKYYLKSLDHQGINFKQNDVKALRSKALFNEIETLYDERHEQAEEGANEVASGPHLVLPYRDKSVLDDAANLLIHHVKRQTGIHKEDKQHIKQMLRHFIPDLFFHPRQELSDDEREDDMQEDQEDGEGSNQGGKSTNNNGSSSKASKSEPEVKKEAETEIKAAAAAAPPGATPTPAKPSSQCGSVSSGSNSSNSSNAGDKETLALPPHAISSLPDEHYTLFMASNTWYLFLRLHQILCERLTRMYERAMSLAAEEAQNKLDRKESTAVALRLKPKNDIEVEDYYPAFLDMVKNVLDGNMESNAYEDTLREMFGIHAYIAFTLDKVVTYAVRQLQSLVVDESSQECFEMFLEEQKKGAAGGACSQAAHNLSVEMAYQRRAEQALAEENCYKVYIYKRDCRLTIELLDSEVEEPEAATEGEKGASYLEKYVSGLDTLSEDVRERLARKPVFLPRNVRHYQRRGGNTEPMEVDENPKEQDSKADVKDESKDKASNSSNNEGEGKEKRPSESPPPPGSQAESVDGTECKFNLSSYTRVYVVDKESIMYKREALLKAKESHPAVSRKLSRLFRAWHRSWADEHVSEEQQKQSTEWLMGLGENVIPNRTRIVTNNDLSRPPYCRYNRYRVERLAEPPAQASSTSSGAPSSS